MKAEHGRKITRKHRVVEMLAVSSIAQKTISVFLPLKTSLAFSALTLLVGRQEGHPACKKLSGGVLAWLSVWSEMQTCILPSWCHCHSLSLASVKSRLVLPFWYRLTRVVLDNRPLNVCVCVCVFPWKHLRSRKHKAGLTGLGFYVPLGTDRPLWTRFCQITFWLRFAETKSSTTTKWSKLTQKTTQNVKPKQTHNKTKPEPSIHANSTTAHSVITVNNCSTQNSMQQFQLSSLLASRQSPEPRRCVLEERGCKIHVTVLNILTTTLSKLLQTQKNL